MVEPKEGATLVDIRSIITPAQQVAKTVAPTITPQVMPQQSTEDWMDKILKLAETFDSILSKGEQLEGMIARVADKKGVTSRHEGQPDNPVLAQKREVVVHAQDAPEQPKGNPSDKPKPQEQKTTEVKPMQINDEYVDNVIETVEDLAKTKIPEKFQNMTVKELVTYLDKPIVGNQIRGMFKKELIEVIKGATNADTENESSKEQKNS